MIGDLGLIWVSTWRPDGAPLATVGLIVRDLDGVAIVADCPPYARSWALGTTARRAWDTATRQPRTEVRWIPARSRGDRR